jgi:hypothetical protein
MDEYDYRIMDKQMSEELNAIFGNPARHKFYSIYEADEAEDRRGPRGGKIRGSKRICFHCGQNRKRHADKTE